MSPHSVLKMIGGPRRLFLEKAKLTKSIALLFLFFFLPGLFGCGGDGGGDAGGALVVSPTERLYSLAIDNAPNQLHERVDHIAAFIFANSRHVAAAEGEATVEDVTSVDLMAEAMLAFVEGEGPQPIMRCGHRNNLLKALLQFDGINSRLVNILGDGRPDGHLYGHVLMEYEDPVENRWIIGDADMRFYWINLSGERIGVLEAIRDDYSELIPCTLEGECGYDKRNPENQDPQIFVDMGLFSAALILEPLWDLYIYSELYFNTQKMDPNTVLDGMTILERYDYLPTTYF